jgi:dihydrofolate reductase
MGSHVQGGGELLHQAGDVEVPMAGYPMTFRVAPASAKYLSVFLDSLRHSAFVCGRRVFEHTHGRGGHPPGGGAAFVVTHRPPPTGWPADHLAPFTFCADVESAVEQAKAAGDGTVGVSGPSIAQQCLNLGQLDEVRIDLVPALLGEGCGTSRTSRPARPSWSRWKLLQGKG